MLVVVNVALAPVSCPVVHFSDQHFGKFPHLHVPCSHMSWYITLNYQCLLF